MQPFYLTHLYPKEMSIYGDMGNIIALMYRLRKMGFEVVYQELHLGSELPKKTDLFFIGGGQDQEQMVIFEDLQKKKEQLVDLIEQGVPMLAICGGYQLLGKTFLTGEGVEIPGIGLFPVETKAPDSSVKSRCIGNIIIECQIPELKGKTLVGFENHSGQTFFTDQGGESSAYPLGKVLTGYGNNASEKLEGCVYKNAIGTYLHGSCLPKNPELTSYLIKQALQVKIERGQNDEVDVNAFDIQISDEIALHAKASIIKRFLV